MSTNLNHQIHAHSEILTRNRINASMTDFTSRIPMPRAVGESDEYFRFSSVMNQHKVLGKSSPFDDGDIISILQEIIRTLRIFNKSEIHVVESVTLNTILVKETSNRVLNAFHKWKIGFPIEPKGLKYEIRSELEIVDDLSCLCQQLVKDYEVQMPQLNFSSLKSPEEQFKIGSTGMGKNFHNKQKFFTSLPEQAVYTNKICTTKGRISSFQFVDCRQCQCHTCKLKRKCGLQLKKLECSCGRQRYLPKCGKAKIILLRTASRIKILLRKLYKWLVMNCPANVTGVLVGLIASIVTAPAGGTPLAIIIMIVSTIIAWLLQFSVDSIADAWS
ncbi:unnamed protein product [Meganyctiphanes norvegica]|uniref:Phorbol-ester/DAG-type domain-containing protein n=1 Tax=Meganyctiphanes norvegica TaxID=48144 RepID=A0AAV2PNZ7_MEGNR